MSTDSELNWMLVFHLKTEKSIKLVFRNESYCQIQKIKKCQKG